MWRCRSSFRDLAELAQADAHLPAVVAALRSGGFRLLSCAHPGVIVYVRSTEAMTVLVAGNVTAAGASISLDLSDWDGERTGR